MAKELNIDMELIRVKPSNNFANVNGSVTGGGMGSEGNCSVNIKYFNNNHIEDQRNSWNKMVEQNHTRTGTTSHFG